MVELKPCPFCGNKAVLHDYGFIEGTSGAHVECSVCAVETEWYDGSPEGAIAAWNTRADATLEAEVSRLKALNANLMGDDEDLPRYTTKRLRQEIERARERDAAEIATLKAEVERLTKALSEQVDRDISGIFTPQDAGEAVAWRYRAMGLDGKPTPWLWAHVRFEDESGMEVQPLYTHPAPPVGEPTEAGERDIVDQLTGALRFIMAFYEPGQTYLDTEAWKQAEAGGRRALARGEAVLASRKGRAGE